MSTVMNKIYLKVLIITHGVGSLNNKSIDSAEVFKLLMEKENKIKALERQIEELKLLTKTDSLKANFGYQSFSNLLRTCNNNRYFCVKN